MNEPDRNERRYITSDGISLATENTGITKPKARIVVVHGYGEHKGRYSHVISRLSKARIDCHLFDLRGHGSSEGPRGYVRSFNDYLSDLVNIIKTTQKEEKLGTNGHKDSGSLKTPLFLLGHSLGGLICLGYILRPNIPLSGVILSNPFLESNIKAPRILEFVLRRAAKIFPRLSIPGRIDPSFLSRDPSVGDRYRKDRLILRKLNIRWYLETEKEQRFVLSNRRRIGTPMFLALGLEDPIAVPETAFGLFQATASPSSRCLRLPSLRHEVLNEPGWEDLVDKMEVWIDQQLENPQIA
ncbi:MAG: lysophospholipase [Acidobacteriota bacterium]